jgi:hypothetical protein
MRKLWGITVFSLYTLQIFAEKTISEDNFKHFVDYATCKYVLAFTEKSDQYLYEKIKPILGKIDLKELDKVPSYDSIKRLLKNENSAWRLVEKINERKSAFGKSKDDTDLINLLKAKKWDDVSLSETSTNVQNEIQNTLVTASPSMIGTYTECQEMLYKQLDKLEKRQQRNEAIISNYQRFQSIVLAICSLFIILFILLFLMINRINKKFIKNSIAQTTEIKPYTLTEKDIQNITNEVWNRLEKRRKEQSALLPIIDNSNKTISPKPTYLKGKNGKIFSRVEHTPENSFFRIFGERVNSMEVEFEFSGNEEEAIAKRIFQDDDIFRILSGNCQNAHSVKMVKPGKVKRVGEQWEVIEPILIKLI